MNLTKALRSKWLVWILLGLPGVASGDEFSFTYLNGVFDTNYPNLYFAGINDAGQIVGHTSGCIGCLTSFELDNGVMTQITTAGSGLTAVAINNGGQILELSQLNEMSSLVTNGVSVPLPIPPGGVESYYFSLNDAGAVLGSGAAFDWVVYSNGAFNFLNLPANYNATAIADSGAVVGFYSNSGAIGAFIDTNGVITPFTTPGASVAIEAISSNGNLAGLYVPNSGYTLHPREGFVYENGTVTPITLPGYDVYITGVNSSGEVVGWASTYTGPYPTPEPSSIVLVATCLFGCFAMARKGRP